MFAPEVRTIVVIYTRIFWQTKMPMIQRGMQIPR